MLRIYGNVIFFAWYDTTWTKPHQDRSFIATLMIVARAHCVVDVHSDARVFQVDSTNFLCQYRPPEMTWEGKNKSI